MGDKRPISIRCTKGAAGALLYLVVDRLCAISNDWSGNANAERKRLEAIRKMLEEALLDGQAPR